MKVFIVLLMVAVTFAFEIREQSCPTNKTWGDFGDCPPSCYNTNNEDNRPCNLILYIGCKCAPGYILLGDRDSSSNCIKPEDCP
ncbi:hypothetical protein CDAR_292681 [Caerostris darwini]|uniref:TIL domain-containing protein n=1 Tax=Caerostris darwini TaxID=1538125 RepID=A0AAV4PUJ4_9ARAC|nr:hypothetical protein CDAR_292681 [Caerostris darwini]